MTGPQMNHRAEKIVTDINKVESVVATAQRLLTEGKMVDLAALENKVSEICGTISGLDDGEMARPLLPKLEALMDNLDALASDLQAQHGALDLLATEEETTPEAAARAYTAPLEKDKD